MYADVPPVPLHSFWAVRGSDLLETRVIDGVKYILICADESVEVNGVPISIEKEKQPV